MPTMNSSSLQEASGIPEIAGGRCDRPALQQYSKAVQLMSRSVRAMAQNSRRVLPQTNTHPRWAAPEYFPHRHVIITGYKSVFGASQREEFNDLRGFGAVAWPLLYCAA
jgi:hypothetical protein